MATTSPRQKLDEAIEATARKLQRLKALRDAMNDDDIMDDIALIFAPSTNGAVGKDTPTKPRSKNMERIYRYFRNRNNQWATAKEIVSGAKVKLNSLRQLLYRSHVEEFDRDGQVGFGKQSRFRLKEVPPE
jgi:hypothetical protein